MNNIMITAIISMASLAAAFAIVLGLAHKKLKVEEDPRIGKISGILPGVNCGACGYLSCHDFAEHIVAEGADPAKCRILGEEESEALHDIMGSEKDASSVRAFPVVRCAAGADKRKTEGRYEGLASCSAAQQIFGGGLMCRFGCMGFGDCVQACPFGALRMSDGLPEVIEEKCTSCGKCVAACPRGLIEMVPKKNEQLFYVACSSTDDGLTVRSVCGTGCIACGICEKLSQKEKFAIERSLAREKIEAQGNAEELEKIRTKCPTKVIKRSG